MRYAIQITVMLTELIILAVVVFVFAMSFKYHNSLYFIMGCLGVWFWHKDFGIFASWRPSVIKKFLANAKKQGL